MVKFKKVAREFVEFIHVLFIGVKIKVIVLSEYGH